MRKENHWTSPIRISLQEKPKRILSPNDTLWKVNRGFDLLSLRWRIPFRPVRFLGMLLMLLSFFSFSFFLFLMACGVVVVNDDPPPHITIRLFIGTVATILSLTFLSALYLQIRDAGLSKTWTFSQGSARYGLLFFGYGKMKNFPVIDWQAMEIRMLDCLEDGEFKEMRRAKRLSEIDWGIIFLDRSGEEILAITDGLDKEEARWLADVLLQEKNRIQPLWPV